MLFLSCTANFIVHVFPSNSFRLQSAAEVSHKHYLAVSLALATGSMQLQQFQESVGSQCSLGWLPVLSSNMRGLTLQRWGVPDLHGLLSFPHAHSSQTAHTLQATRQHAAGSGTAEWRNGGGRFLSSSCRQPGTAKYRRTVLQYRVYWGVSWYRHLVDDKIGWHYQCVGPHNIGVCRTLLKVCRFSRKHNTQNVHQSKP